MFPSEVKKVMQELGISKEEEGALHHELLSKIPKRIPISETKKNLSSMIKKLKRNRI